MIYFELDYEGEKPNYVETSEQSYVVTGPPTATVEQYLRLTRNGQCVGTLSATFDFSEVPPEFHSLALSYILGSRVNIHVGF